MTNISVEPFDWSFFNHGPPKNCRVIRANDHCLIIERNRSGYKERFIAAKLAIESYGLFRINYSYGEREELSDATIVMRSSLRNILIALGYPTTIARKSEQVYNRQA